MNIQTAQARRPLRGRMHRTKEEQKKEERILVLKSSVAGLRYYIENDEEQKALEALTAGTELLLYREPDNKHDEWAIAVYRTEEDKLGFVTKFKNETIARLMDVGKKFVCVVEEYDKKTIGAMKRRKHRGQLAPTETMELPISIYLVEESSY